jgi:hypothetical protein
MGREETRGTRGGVSHTLRPLPFTLKWYLKAKEEL